MELNFGSEILALFLCVMWTIVVMWVGAMWNSKRELFRDIVLAMGELAGVILIANWCGAPAIGIILSFALIIGYDHFFDAWKLHHPPSPLHRC